jgi:hypothetical protein
MHREALFLECFRNPLTDQKLVLDKQDPNRRNVTD